jgi:thiaminase/transcriptional activator TenA
MTTKLSGTKAIWDRIDPIYRRVLEHPFLTGLRDGTLDHAAFGRYIVQDTLYLREYARSLALCAARGADSSIVEMFCAHSASAIATERLMHASLMDRMGIDPESLDGATASPTCFAYTSFTKQACAMGERHEAIASVLPCYWIYREVGHELMAAGSPDPAYQVWIDTYADPVFNEAVEGALAACDAVAGDLGPAATEAMVAAAETAARYEWMFWDSAYRDERWPELA